MTHPCEIPRCRGGRRAAARPDRPSFPVLLANGLRLSLVLAALWLAAGAVQGAQLSTQREDFATADRALQAGDETLYRRLKADLEAYPLYPYLLFRDLSRRLADHPVGEVRSFLRTYADSPVAERLRTAWLEQLARDRHWDAFLQDYQPGTSVTLDCWHRQALLDTGRRAAALQGIERLWLQGSSLPDACDPVFEAWRGQGGMTREQVWKRFGLAVGGGELRLARYLQRLLPAADRSLSELWLAVDANPHLVLESQRFDPANPRTAAILIHGLRRWSNIDSVTAATALDTLRQRYRLPKDEVIKLDRRLALYVASRGAPDGLTRLTALPPEEVDTSVREWRIRAAMQRGDWPDTLRWLDELPPGESQEEQWQYWRARALEAIGREDDARRIYSRLAGQRDYHGFLAADRLGVPYQVKGTTLRVPAAELDALLARLPGLQRARELYLLGRRWEAGAEWTNAVRTLGGSDLKKAAKLAQSWGWHDQAITTLARSGYWDDLELRFPMPHREQVLASARSEGIDPAWIYAVMRQESIFRPDATSGAGALGLMQIMPATGQRLARDLQMSLPDRYALLEADTNIRYGTRYLRHTLDRLQDNPLLATAAYNAGPQRVSQWLPDRATDADLWAETIPYFETRKYVKRVMEYTVIYERRLGQAIGSVLSRMGRILPAPGE